MFTNVRSDFQGRYRTRRGIPSGASRRVPLGPDDETYTFNTAGIVGGGSVLYTAITNTPYQADYQVWSDETGLDLSYQNLKYAAEETERAFNIHTKPDGLLRVGDRLFRDSARALGIEVNPAKIAKQNCLWCGYCDGVNMCKYDARGGSFTGYLPTALEHGVEIIPDAKAEKVLIEKQGAGFRVTGVAYIRNGERGGERTPGGGLLRPVWEHSASASLRLWPEATGRTARRGEPQCWGPHRRQTLVRAHDRRL